MASAPDAFGDFQTPHDLARQVWQAIDAENVDLVVEPTVGVGAFLSTAPPPMRRVPWRGFDINGDYVADSKRVAWAQAIDAHIDVADVFSVAPTDFPELAGRSVLVVGNPPWVTSAGQSRLLRRNLPVKSNRAGLRGLDALTGKANFDVAEAVLLRVLHAVAAASEIRVALLVKRSVALKLARDLLGTPGLREASFRRIDAKRWFDASVEAGLLQLRFRPSESHGLSVIELAPGLDGTPEGAAGVVGGNFVFDVSMYEQSRSVEAADGGRMTWRQGIKHDASRVLELRRDSAGDLINGLGDRVEVEADALHPFFKSSDVAQGRPARFLFPLYQHNLSGPLDGFETRWPKLASYLRANREALAARGSSIYRNKPDYMLFGVGDYTLAPWKVAISGFYKTPVFSVLGPSPSGHAPLVDDTCYLLPFKDESAARETVEYLNCPEVQGFLRAICDPTAKRPYTKELLGRITMLHAPERLAV